jgi:hypothetical protein
MAINPGKREGGAVNWTTRRKGALLALHAQGKEEVRMDPKVVATPSRAPDYAVAAVVVLALLASVALLLGVAGV